MSKYILEYKRDERVKYISHLDFIRLFHRTVRRGGLEFLYSEGFNPHPVMTVAMPLSVGVTADCEYMKVGFEDKYTEEEIKERINAAFPPGYEINSVYKLKAKEKDITKISEAEYTVAVELEKDAVPCNPDNIMANKELIVLKKTKSGEKESDIRPYIYEIKQTAVEENVVTYKMRLSCGNDYNLKPETVIAALEKYGDNFKTSFVCVHRNRLILPKE